MNSNFLKLTYFISLIFISAGIYINTYWGGFGIDIFPYIAIGEFVMYGLAPLINQSLPVLVGLLITFIFLEKLFPFGGYKARQKEEIQTGKKIITKFERFTMWFVIVVIFILSPLGLILAYSKNEEAFYQILPNIVAPFSILVTNRLMVYEAIKDVTIDSKIIFLTVFILFSSFSSAKLDSIKVITNKEFKYIIENDKFYKYLGKGGDYFFFETLDNEQTIIRSNTEFRNLNYFKFNGILNTKSDSIIHCKIQLKKHSTTQSHTP